MGTFAGFLGNNEKHRYLLTRDFPTEVALAEKCVSFTAEFIDAITIYNPLFDHFYGHTVKHLHLALRSLLEMQRTEAGGNLRQALEGVCVAAYALLCSKEELVEFMKLWDDGRTDNRDLMKKVYTVVAAHSPEVNAKIKLFKDQINSHFSHVLAVPSFGTQAFHTVKGAEQKFLVSLSDQFDEFHIRSFFFHIANSAITVADLLLCANAVSSVFTTSKIQEFHALAAEIQEMQKEMRKHPKMQPKKEE